MISSGREDHLPLETIRHHAAYYGTHDIPLAAVAIT